MNILEIAKRVGSGLVRELVPGGGLLIDTINQFLPEDKKLPPSASGDQVAATVSSLPPELQAQVMLKQFDVDIKQIDERINATTQANDTLRIMLAQDAVTPHTTRPKIAWGCFWVLAASTLSCVFAFLFAVITKDVEMVREVMRGGDFVVWITGTFATIELAYFGVLRGEHRDKLDAANNLPTRSGGFISKLLKR